MRTFSSINNTVTAAENGEERSDRSPQTNRAEPRRSGGPHRGHHAREREGDDDRELLAARCGREETRVGNRRAGCEESEEANLAVASEQTTAFDSDWDGNPWKLTRDESRANLERNKKKAEIELREGKRRVGHQGLTIAIAQERFQAANKELQQLQDAINSLAMMKSTLESDNDKRKKKWMNRLKKSSRDVQTMFVRYVEEKEAGGAIEFNHKQEKTLTIKYQVEKGDPTTMRDICQLSGGEHSFVTFSFQLALGHVESGLIHDSWREM